MIFRKAREFQSSLLQIVDTLYSIYFKMKFTSELKKYIANTSWLVVERLFRMSMMLFVGIYIARHLGPELFGTLNYSYSFTSLFLALSTLGLDGIVVRELVKYPERRGEILGAAFVLKTAGTFLMWGGIIITIPLMHNDTEINLLIYIIAFAVVFRVFNVIDFDFQARVQSKYVVHAQLAQVIISSSVLIFLVAIEASLLWFAMIYILDALLLGIFLIIAYLKNNYSFHIWSFKWEVVQSLLKDSWPLILSGLAISIYMKMDQVMIKGMLGVDDVGIYAAAARLSEAWYFLPVVIAQSLFPAIIDAKSRCEKLYHQRLQKIYNLTVRLAIVIALPAAILSPWVIKLLYGYEYLESANVLSIHIWASVFVFYGVVWSRWMMAENRQKMMMVFQLNAMFFNILLNYLFIPKYGPVGAAYATLIAASVGHTILPLFIKSQRIALVMFLRTLYLYRRVDSHG